VDAGRNSVVVEIGSGLAACCRHQDRDHRRGGVADGWTVGLRELVVYTGAGGLGECFSAAWAKVDRGPLILMRGGYGGRLCGRCPYVWSAGDLSGRIGDVHKGVGRPITGV